MSRWSPPDPDISTAHDVRKLRTCNFCKAIGTSLLHLDAYDKAAWAHAYCLVTARGLEQLAVLPAAEIGKTTLADMRGLGRPVDEILAMLDAAERREGGGTTATKAGRKSKR